jgi:hypothetical protein
VRTSEKVTLHFDLSHCPQDVEFTLHAGGASHKLTAYADAPGKLEEHRASNSALALIPEEHIGRITHFVEDGELVADHPTVRKVVYPSLDDHPLPEIAVVFVHVPTADQRRFVRLRPASADHMPHLDLLAHYGVETHLLGEEADHDRLRLDAANIKDSPRETAKSLVFHHYEIGSTNPIVASDVLENYITQADGFVELYSYIQENGPGTENAWYQKTYATWLNPDTGKEEPVPANPDLKFKDDGKPAWPIVDGQPRIPQYDLTDEYTDGSKDGGVVGAATKVVRNVLVETKNAEQFNGHLWTTQAGTTARVQNNVAPAPQAPKAHPNVVEAAAPRLMAGVDSPAKGFAVKNVTSSYGLWLYDDTLAFDSTSKTLSFQVKNWPSRYLSMYVQFRKSTGEPIKRSDIPGWDDPMPSFLRGAFEPSDTKNYLALLGAGAAIFGAPVPFLTQRTDVAFKWPDDASSAHVLLGGLGVAEGFRDWDPDVDIGGIVGTGLVCYGWGALSLVLTVYVVNPLMVKIGEDKDVETAFYIIGGLVGAVAAAVGGPMYGTSAGKFILSKLASQVAGIIFGIVSKRIIMAAARTAIEKVIAESVVEITAEQALTQVPVAGWALKIAGVAANVAAMAATTIECLASPATYDLQIQRTMDLTVTVKPDPRHGGDRANWPLVADHWIVQVKYPKAPGAQGGTTYTKAGPMPGPPHNQPLVIPFPQIPAGGKIEVVAGVYSENDWLAGQWDSGWINAVPDANDQLTASGNIQEKLVPLTPTTTYSQKQRVVYSDAQKHHWQVTRFAISSDLIKTLDQGTVDDAVRAAFAAQGSDLSRSVSLAVQTMGEHWKLSDTGNGVEYQLDKRKVFSGDGSTLYEVAVQNLTHAAPTLPAVIHDCANDGHRMCQLQNVTYNDKEYMVGYAWQASGQNMPRDFGTSPDNGQMYAFQAISALGQPQDSIIEPSRGFTNPSLIAFDQFGLAPVFAITDAKQAGNVKHYQDELNAGGAVPADLAAEIASFNVKLPGGSTVAVVTKDQRWTIGSPSANPVLDLRLLKEVVDTGSGPQLQNVINVYAWPVPSQDNFYLDSRVWTKENKQYFVRGVSFAPGASTFDYDSKKSWGQFQDVTINDLAVHPQGYIVGVDYDNHKLLTLKLGADPVDDAKAPIAMPLSGEGVREGLLNKPVALTITADGRILVLEEVNQRIQAFDVLGNPVPCFSVGQQAFKLDKSLLATLDKREATTPLVQAFQRNVVPATAPLFHEGHLDDDPEKENLAPASAKALDEGKVDKALSDYFVKYGYARNAEGGAPPTFKVDITTAGSLWLVTDTASSATFDVRYLDADGEKWLFIFSAFAIGIEIKSAGSEWLLTDTANAMTFDVANKAPVGAPEPDLQAKRLVATMPLRTQGQAGVNHLDVAVEATGYIYTLYTVDKSGTKEYMLDVYAPDGTPVFDQSGIYAAKLTVDQWRSMFTLNYEKILGPGQRTEPSVSQWEPSTPAGDGPTKSS